MSQKYATSGAAKQKFKKVKDENKKILLNKIDTYLFL